MVEELVSLWALEILGTSVAQMIPLQNIQIWAEKWMFQHYLHNSLFSGKSPGAREAYSVS